MADPSFASPTSAFVCSAHKSDVNLSYQVWLWHGSGGADRQVVPNYRIPLKTEDDGGFELNIPDLIQYANTLLCTAAVGGALPPLVLPQDVVLDVHAKSPFRSEEWSVAFVGRGSVLLDRHWNDNGQHSHSTIRMPRFRSSDPPSCRITDPPYRLDYA